MKTLSSGNQNTKILETQLNEEKYKQIWKVCNQFQHRVDCLQAEAEWFVGMLIYDHGITQTTNHKQHDQFVKILSRRLRKDLIKSCSSDWLNDCLDTYLAYPLLEEIIIPRWVKNYDIREYEKLRPELVRARDTLIGKAIKKGIVGTEGEES
ncbi:MAG: hypothetical protein A3G33_08225 [Omnitrophica bacterium RIFCSPLOWO2_12_FULL_44_17]|uniref:Uncharacterized protein n=1 Tax=Candidatus Danuiimicrobium aquiferis TaxID=1801832 RepID=A0A1G1KW86_9BACT|nr:MAG: hypothetical protein A3B72_03440 [Omnitrophica bacterium RIFCSPHIGHO2_02_FULL_45_28]OGW92609.1 MAG: hypothetical protein A3E74_02470 [Omnitrophica bacterium RIFCSPHIGHO2_12_FULL_44_12]OGW97151.1 MAG: hypothetical protein A3G33_08225 [Omnitrophica bacterium RIFCSPLOWO2_12_FULL_44_17]OGX02211.1 MAG: hypothetical protein A3J12_08000 [Omnitrophica bacterium RIFCSPLOWO2_02_FULL_44_11]